jgi:hypothetical protein
VVGQGSDMGHAQIHTRLTESDPVSQMGQNQIKPRIALGAPFKVEIPANINYLLGP